MARLQILELPEGAGDDRPPFVLVVDQASEDIANSLNPQNDGTFSYDTAIKRLTAPTLVEQIGARAVLVFEETVDIPANDLTLTHVQEAADGNVIRLRVEPDLTGFQEKVEEEVLYAQGKATRALKPDDQEDWHGILMGRRRQLAKALSINPLNDWDGILEAATKLHEQHALMRVAADSVRNLHRPVEHNGQTICWECSAYDFAGRSTDNPPVAHDQCGTLRALNAQQQQT